jgi:hypothetical protein
VPSDSGEITFLFRGIRRGMTRKLSSKLAIRRVVPSIQAICVMLGSGCTSVRSAESFGRARSGLVGSVRKMLETTRPFVDGT